VRVSHRDVDKGLIFFWIYKAIEGPQERLRTLNDEASKRLLVRHEAGIIASRVVSHLAEAEMLPVEKSFDSLRRKIAAVRTRGITAI
jgi:hypothetical protein